MGAEKPNDLARLAFWAKAMIGVRDSGSSWPGFSYKEAEWARLRALAGCIDGPEGGRFIIFNALVFIAIAAVAITAFLTLILTFAGPRMANIGPTVFEALLAAAIAVILGCGLPLSMRVAAHLATTDALRARLHAAPEDAALWAKVRFQLSRITVIACGLIVPCMMLFVAFNIDAGQWIAAVKLACGAIVILSAIYCARPRAN